MAASSRSKPRRFTFGATDKPLSEQEFNDNGLVQFPTVVGGIVPVINVGGVKSDALVLDGATLAKIFLGEITTWDDAAIKQLNPKVKLPSETITVVHRSDGSGTTFNFTNHLSKVSETWQSKIGFEVTIEWPVGVGAKGNKGVAGKVADTEGAIGYVEHAYAKQQQLTFANMINQDGKVVAPGRQCRLGDAALRRDADRSARRGVVADYRRDLHPDA